MRIRTVKPMFFKDEELAEQPPLNRLLFQGLWLLADKEGRLEDRPKYIKVEVLPYDDCDVDKMLSELAPKFIFRYEIEGRKYIQVNKFVKHQRISGKESEYKTEIPPSNYIGEALGKQSGSTGEALGITGNRNRNRIVNSNGIVRERGMGETKETTTHTKKFQKPTLGELQDYCKQIGAEIDPQRFLDFYDSKGWVVGKSPMRDWRAAVRTWKGMGRVRNDGSDQNRTGRIHAEADKYARFDK